MRSLMRVAGSGLRRFARAEGGTQLVELAIVLPVLMAFFVATAEFGRYFHSYATLAKATRAGARYLATTPVKTAGGPEGGTNAAEDLKVKRLVVYGDPDAADGSKPVAPGLTLANVELKRVGKPKVPDTVTVRIVNYSYKPLLNLGGFADGLKWTSVPVRPSTTMRYLLTQPSA